MPRATSAMRHFLVTTALLFAASATATEANRIEATIVAVGFEYANIDTDLDHSTLVQSGLSTGDQFSVIYGSETLSVTLGSDYGDVEAGQWIALPTDGNKVQLAISFGHACTAIECTAGDKLTVVLPPAAR